MKAVLLRLFSCSEPDYKVGEKDANAHSAYYQRSNLNGFYIFASLKVDEVKYRNSDYKNRQSHRSDMAIYFSGHWLLSLGNVNINCADAFRKINCAFAR